MDFNDAGVDAAISPSAYPASAAPASGSALRPLRPTPAPHHWWSTARLPRSHAHAMDGHAITGGLVLCILIGLIRILLALRANEHLLLRVCGGRVGGCQRRNLRTPLPLTRSPAAHSAHLAGDCLSPHAQPRRAGNRAARGVRRLTRTTNWRLRSAMSWPTSSAAIISSTSSASLRQHPSPGIRSPTWWSSASARRGRFSATAWPPA